MIIGWLRKRIGWILGILAGVLGAGFLWKLHQNAVVDAETRAELAEARAEAGRLAVVRDQAKARADAKQEEIEDLDRRIERVHRGAVEMIRSTESMDSAEVAEAFEALGY